MYLHFHFIPLYIFEEYRSRRRAVRSVLLLLLYIYFPTHVVNIPFPYKHGQWPSGRWSHSAKGRRHLALLLHQVVERKKKRRKKGKKNEKEEGTVVFRAVKGKRGKRKERKIEVRIEWQKVKSRGDTVSEIVNAMASDTKKHGIFSHR